MDVDDLPALAAISGASPQEAFVRRSGGRRSSARTSNAFEDTVQHLLQAIRLGVVNPGQQLPAERDLSVMLGVSRDTLRDAIAALTGAGYVVARRGRYGGTFIVDPIPRTTPSSIDHGPFTPPTRDEVEDALVLRRVAETGAARRAAACELSSADRGRLWAAHAECRDSAAEDYRRMDSRLHLLVAEVTGSPSLVALAANARTRVNDLLDQIPLLAPNIEHSNHQHEEIVKAILRGAPDAAEAAMDEHLAATEALLRGFLT